MTHTNEALKLALQSLESCSGVPHWPAICATIVTIKQALAAPVQEPVAWMFDCGNGGRMYAEDLDASVGWLPLYTTPPAQPEPVQEPFGYVYEVYCLPECALEMEWVEGFDRYQPDAKNNIRNVTPVYTTPPSAQPAQGETK